MKTISLQVRLSTFCTSPRVSAEATIWAESNFGTRAVFFLPMKGIIRPIPSPRPNLAMSRASEKSQSPPQNELSWCPIRLVFLAPASPPVHSLVRTITVSANHFSHIHAWCLTSRWAPYYVCY